MQLDSGFSNSFSPIQTPTKSFDYESPLGGGASTNTSFTPATSSPFFNGSAAGSSVNPFAATMGMGARQPQDPQIAQANGLRPTSQFGGPNWTPTYQTPGGYNPSQYATVDTANSLAGSIGSGLGLGGNVIQTQSSGPGGPPPQQMIDFGGDSPLNAGLLAERYKKYDHDTADRMTRDELALQGPKPAMNADMQGGAMGSYSQFAPSEGGSLNLGGGQNIGQFVGENKPWAANLASSGVIRQPVAAPGQPALGASVPPPVPTTPPVAATPPTTTVTPPPAAPAPAPAPTPPAAPQFPTNQQNLGQLQQLIQLLQGMRQPTPQNRQPYANSRYYPNLPRQTTATAVNQAASAPSAANSTGSATNGGNPPKPPGMTDVEYQNYLFVTGRSKTPPAGTPANYYDGMMGYNPATGSFDQAPAGNPQYTQQPSGGNLQQAIPQLLSLLLGF